MLLKNAMLKSLPASDPVGVVLGGNLEAYAGLFHTGLAPQYLRHNSNAGGMDEGEESGYLEPGVGVRAAPSQAPQGDDGRPSAVYRAPAQTVHAPQQSAAPADDGPSFPPGMAEAAQDLLQEVPPRPAARPHSASPHGHGGSPPHRTPAPAATISRLPSPAPRHATTPAPRLPARPASASHRRSPSPAQRPASGPSSGRGPSPPPRRGLVQHPSETGRATTGGPGPLVSPSRGPLRALPAPVPLPVPGDGGGPVQQQQQQQGPLHAAQAELQQALGATLSSLTQRVAEAEQRQAAQANEQTGIGQRLTADVRALQLPRDLPTQTRSRAWPVCVGLQDVGQLRQGQAGLRAEVSQVLGSLRAQMGTLQRALTSVLKSVEADRMSGFLDRLLHEQGDLLSYCAGQAPVPASSAGAFPSTPGSGPAASAPQQLPSPAAPPAISMGGPPDESLEAAGIATAEDSPNRLPPDQYYGSMYLMTQGQPAGGAAATWASPTGPGQSDPPRGSPLRLSPGVAGGVPVWRDPSSPAPAPAPALQGATLSGWGGRPEDEGGDEDVLLHGDQSQPDLGPVGGRTVPGDEPRAPPPPPPRRSPPPPPPQPPTAIHQPPYGSAAPSGPDMGAPRPRPGVYKAQDFRGTNPGPTPIRHPLQRAPPMMSIPPLPAAPVSTPQQPDPAVRMFGYPPATPPQGRSLAVMTPGPSPPAPSILSRPHRPRPHPEQASQGNCIDSPSVITAL
ncbi:hypothetical protein PAPYR_5601 [Paratrimastix pyriformis]|uniref:Uncharacterized protein n=1 Tax=Paratrimastix pyriformis TaxID=342808 RepID=A0ABQ8UK89_9EUKA|nr:hypothetical protein PAPYR_5601 [Paratrimastix pyriformis]